MFLSDYRHNLTTGEAVAPDDDANIENENGPVPVPETATPPLLQENNRWSLIGGGDLSDGDNVVTVGQVTRSGPWKCRLLECSTG